MCGLARFSPRSLVAVVTFIATGAVTAAIAGAHSCPARVVAFLDVRGAWDPTLAFVMGGAILVHAPIVRLVRARRAPIYDTRFHWPTRTKIDLQLVLGAALFGVGWGLSGYCPGPALVAVVSGAPATVLFVTAMLCDIGLGRQFLARRASS